VAQQFEATACSSARARKKSEAAQKTSSLALELEMSPKACSLWQIVKY